MICYTGSAHLTEMIDLCSCPNRKRVFTKRETKIEFGITKEANQFHCGFQVVCIHIF